MVDPIVDSMIEQSPSKYALVIAVARRARELVDGDDPEARAYPVTHALWEMATGYAGVDDWSETYAYGQGAVEGQEEGAAGYDDARISSPGAGSAPDGPGEGEGDGAVGSDAGGGGSLA